MKTTKTNRGFSLAKFQDRYGVPCSLQKSSLATENAIWLGVEEVLVFKNIAATEAKPAKVADGICARMHLTQKDVKKLLPALQFFAERGELPETAAELRSFIEGKDTDKTKDSFLVWKAKRAEKLEALK